MRFIKCGNRFFNTELINEVKLSQVTFDNAVLFYANVNVDGEWLRESDIDLTNPKLGFLGPYVNEQDAYNRMFGDLSAKMVEFNVVFNPPPAPAEQPVPEGTPDTAAAEAQPTAV